KIIDHNQLILVVAHDTKRHRSTRSTLFPYTTLFRSDEGDTVIIEYLDGQWSSETGKAPLSSGCGKKWHDPVKEHVWVFPPDEIRSEEHTSELQSREKLVCRLLLENKKEALSRLRQTT